METLQTCDSRPKSSVDKMSSTPSMDIDAALNELGMLSSVTDSRRQYLSERTQSATVSPSTPIRRPRERQFSEPGFLPKTPSNSPQRGTYQILHLNPQYVTSLTTVPGSLRYPGPMDQDNPGYLESNRLKIAQEGFSLPVPPYGAKYSRDMLERDSQTSRLARVKLARLKRFKRPYEVPVRQTSDICYSGCSPLNSGSIDSDMAASLSPTVTTPDRLTRGGSDHKLSNSNTSTPEKQTAQRKLSMQRSRSLDELDFAKIQLAEAENKSNVLQKQEIDSMSHHLQNLQVTE